MPILVHVIKRLSGSNPEDSKKVKTKTPKKASKKVETVVLLDNTWYTKENPIVANSKHRILRFNDYYTHFDSINYFHEILNKGVVVSEVINHFSILRIFFLVVCNETEKIPEIWSSHSQLSVLKKLLDVVFDKPTYAVLSHNYYPKNDKDVPLRLYRVVLCDRVVDPSNKRFKVLDTLDLFAQYLDQFVQGLCQNVYDPGFEVLLHFGSDKSLHNKFNPIHHTEGPLENYLVYSHIPLDKSPNTRNMTTYMEIIRKSAVMIRALEKL